MKKETCPECGCPDCYRFNKRPISEHGKIWWLCPQCGNMPEDRNGKPRNYETDPVDKDPPPSRFPSKTLLSTNEIPPPP